MQPDAPSIRMHSKQDRNWSAVKGDLDAIVLKAMAKETSNRYESVTQLTADIKRYLGGFPVIAQDDTFRYRTQKFIIRHKWSVGGVSLVAFALITSFLITLNQYRIATAERQRADARFDQARSLANNVFNDVYTK